MKLSSSALASIVMLLGSASALGAPSNAAAKPDWWGNDLGKQEVVLPGYSAVVVQDRTLKLGSGRELEWRDGMLPARIAARGAPLASAMRLEQKSGSVVKQISASEVRVTAATPHHAIVESSVELANGLHVRATTRVEYDGTAFVDVVLTPRQPTTVEGLDFVVDVAAAPATTILGFGAKNIREQKHRKDLIATPYAGAFVNAIGIADGQRSFWWFADDAKNWVSNGGAVTAIARDERVVKLTQRLIGTTTTISAPLMFKFGFLVTPVAEMDGSWRRQRVVAGVPDEQQSKRGATFKLWWPEALAHDAFPYTVLPEAAKRVVPAGDITGYPGVDANRRLVQNDRRRFGAEWIPYFSAHVLSNLDPALQMYKREWQIEPTKEFREAVLPSTHVYGKPVLTHRAEGYTDYLLWRFNELIDQLDIAGVYLDHGPVHDSINPLNGGWIDSSGKRQPSLDIVATRAFLKRLRTLFWSKGKPGYIFVHNSNREIVPAYTFAYAQYSGEQYREGRVREGKFLDVVSLDELRARMAGEQYGIRTVWLPIEWTYHEGDKTWRHSEQQRRAYRSYESLGLLHDVVSHTLGAHPAARNELIDALDRFGVNRSNFIGYWNQESDATAGNPAVKISAYERQEPRGTLYIVTNTSSANAATSVSVINQRYGVAPSDLSVACERGLGARRNATQTVEWALDIPANDFRWCTVERAMARVESGTAAP